MPFIFSTPHAGWTDFNYADYIDQDFLIIDSTSYDNPLSRVINFSKLFRASYVSNLPKDMYFFLSVALQNCLDNRLNFLECAFDAEGWEWSFRICLDKIFLIISGDMVFPQKYDNYYLNGTPIPDFIIPLNTTLDKFVDNWINTLELNLKEWIIEWELDDITESSKYYLKLEQEYKKQIETLKQLNSKYKKEQGIE